MRRLRRPPLAPELAGYLDRMQALIEPGLDIAATWKKQRRTSSMRRVAQVLARATGPRERCMYCEDSRGTDIEHFRPQTLYREHVFRWLNFLWICTACNRSKGNRFPCDSAGEPLLIDPTLEEPWDFLFFDQDTGEITARWDPATGEESPKGQSLLDVVSTLRHQAVTEGRRRTAARLRRAIRSFLVQSQTKQDIADDSIRDLVECVEDASDYGIAAWFFLRDGQDEEPFRTLRERFPEIWAEVITHLEPA
jgi:uncharacterized protein (TIGR02646 family)